MAYIIHVRFGNVVELCCVFYCFRFDPFRCRVLLTVYVPIIIVDFIAIKIFKMCVFQVALPAIFYAGAIYYFIRVRRIKIIV